MEYCGVIPKDLATGRLWPQIAALVERSLPYGKGEFELDDIWAGLRDGTLFAAGVAEDARVLFAVICSVCVYPRKRVLYVIHGAGRGGAKLVGAIEEAARVLECDWIETRCRKSVARLYERVGFDVGYATPILEIQR